MSTKGSLLSIINTFDSQNFLIKIVIKTHMSNFMHFQGEMVHFFFKKRGAEKGKC